MTIDLGYGKHTAIASAVETDSLKGGDKDLRCSLDQSRADLRTVMSCFVFLVKEVY